MNNRQNKKIPLKVSLQLQYLRQDTGINFCALVKDSQIVPYVTCMSMSNFKTK